MKEFMVITSMLTDIVLATHAEVTICGALVFLDGKRHLLRGYAPGTWQHVQERV